MKKRNQVAGSFAVAILATALIPGTAAMAAEVTWRNADATSCTEYVELSQSTLALSRTGQRGRLTTVGETSSALVRITVQHGAVNTTQWSNDVTVEGERNYQRGRFSWRNDTCVDSIPSRASATGSSAPSVGGPDPRRQVPAVGAEATDSERIERLAEVYQFDADSAELQGEHEDARVYTLAASDKTLVVTLHESGVSTAGEYKNSEINSRAITIRTTDDEDQVSQFIVASHEAAPYVASISTLERVSETVFIDKSASERETLQRVEINDSGASQARSFAGLTDPPYEVILFGSEEINE